ncbi:hypothetical protein [Streptomyces venezuelae]|uniref:hypothetical protein n=1 Tax=Streptomyces venezuelae TaxID=54571 RepID=UPI00364D71FE
MAGEVELGKLLTDIEAGKSPSAENTPAGEGEWGVLKVSAVQLGRFAPRENKVIRSAELIHRRYEVKHGDLLMTRANTEELVGLVCRIQHPPARLLLSDKTLRLHVDESVADPAFIALVLGQRAVRQSIRDKATGTSAGMKNIGQGQIRQLLVPDVPLEEQRQVVAAHAAFERRIEVLERTQQKLRVATRAVVSQALDVPDRVPFGSWIDRIEAGRSPMAEDTPAGDGEWGVLKVSAVRAGWFVPSENKVVRNQAHVDPAYEVSLGDLLMTRANTEELVGLACVVDVPTRRLMLSDKTLRITPNKKADARFMALALSMPGVRQQIRVAATGTSASMKNIGQRGVRALVVPNVPVEGQRRIAAVISSARCRELALEKQIAKLRTVQRGVVEDLLTGRSKGYAA